MNKTLSKKTLFCAFDVETSGQNFVKHSIIAIGASCIDETGQELFHLFIPLLTQSIVFEDKTWNEFWQYHQDKLENFKYTGSNKDDMVKAEGIKTFQTFRRNVEKYAYENDYKLVFCSDNPVFDGGFINYYINMYTNDLPIPYTASKLIFSDQFKKLEQSYSSFHDVESFQRALLMSIGSTLDVGNKSIYIAKNWSSVLPTKQKQHDHHPSNDAYTIAYDMLAVHVICELEMKPFQ